MRASTHKRDAKIAKTWPENREDKVSNVESRWSRNRLVHSFHEETRGKTELTYFGFRNIFCDFLFKHGVPEEG